MLDCIVIGAGLSGLSAAWKLHREGRSVLVLESADQVGGWIQSVRQGPYLLEGGPNSFPSRHSEAIQALAQEVALPVHPARDLQKKRYIALDGELLPVPSGPLSFLTTPLLSPAAKLRLLTEPFRRPLPGEPTVAEWAAHRLGPQAHDRLVAPFLGGVYAGNTEALSAPAVLPRLWQWEQDHGSVIRGMMASQSGAGGTSHSKKAPYQLLNFANGMAALPQAIARALPQGAVRLGWKARGLRPTMTGYQVDCGWRGDLEAKTVILATPADVSARLLAGVAPEAAELLAGIVYEPITVAYVAFPKAVVSRTLDGFGMLCRWERRKSPLLGSIWSSCLFPERAPADEVLISLFYGGAHYREITEWDEATLHKQVLISARWVLQIATPTKPSLLRTFACGRAIPQYGLGHRERVRLIREGLAARAPGVALAGNYLEGINLNHCVLSGQAAVKLVMG